MIHVGECFANSNIQIQGILNIGKIPCIYMLELVSVYKLAF